MHKNYYIYIYIPGRVIPKTQKMVLDASLLNTQYYKVRIKGKVEPSREGVAPSLTSCSSYRKGSLRVTLDYGRQLYLYIYIYIYIYMEGKYRSIFAYMLDCDIVVNRVRTPVTLLRSLSV